MAPGPMHRLAVPEGMDQSIVKDKKDYGIPQIKDRWENGMLYKDFHHQSIKHYS